MTDHKTTSMRIVFTSLFVLLSTVSALSQRVACPSDILLYPFAKTTAVGDPAVFQMDTMMLDPINSNAVYQYYEAPQDIVIDGARFYAFKTDNTDGDTLTITVELRRTNSDSIPTTLLASATVLIDTADSLTAPFSTFAYDVNWAPVVVNQPYAIVVRIGQLDPAISVFHNNLGLADGDQEWLSGIRQGVSWVRSQNVVVNGQPFDSDFYLFPSVDYELNASFTNDPECLFDELGETVEFFNDGASIVDSRMYNQMAFFGTGTPQEWEFGDGSLPVFIQNPTHFYPSNGPFAASLTASLLNWSGQTCSDDVTQIIKEKPEQDFEYTTDNLEVQFSNNTVGLYSSISYDYGDGNSSSNEDDPFHKYAAPGTYWVCQTMETSCGEIEHCENVAVATNTTLNCGKDSVRFTFARATHVETIDLKNTLPGRLVGVGQRFDVNQSMIVHGFTFYANHEGLFRDSYPVTCRIWNEGVDILPDGAPLGESTVYINKHNVDSNYSDTIRYTAIFDTPVNITDDYILTVEYDSNVPVQISLNGYEQGDGLGELRAIGKINDTTWVSAASVSVFNINGLAINADMIFEPLVEYNLDANFSYNKECLDMRDGQEAVEFTNNSSNIVRSDIYNQIPFYGSSVQAFEWDFGDSAGISNQINPNYNFQGTGPFDVTLTIILEGWTNDCESSQTLNVPVFPTGGFGKDQITSQVIFYDSSANADAYWWTFSDGTFSTLASPVHYFTSVGIFEVCQFVSNVCGSDTTCDTITVSVVGLPENIIEELKVYPNPTSDILNIQAQELAVEQIQFSLHDLSGREIRIFRSAGGYINHQWNLGDLAKGSYLLRMNADGYEGTRLIVLSE